MINIDNYHKIGYGISRHRSICKQLGRDSSFASFQSWGFYRDLSQFFITPNIYIVITESDKESWKKHHPVYLMKGDSDKYEHDIIWLIGITVWNRGKATAQDCKAFLSLIPPFNIRRSLRRAWDIVPPESFYGLGWNKEFTEIKVKNDVLSHGITTFFDRKTDIEPRFAAVLNIFFTMGGSDEVYLTSEKLTSFRTPNVFDVMINVVGSNFSAKVGRYRIILVSRNEIMIRKYTLRTRFADMWLKLRGKHLISNLIPSARVS